MGGIGEGGSGTGAGAGGFTMPVNHRAADFVLLCWAWLHEFILVVTAGVQSPLSIVLLLLPSPNCILELTWQFYGSERG